MVFHPLALAIGLRYTRARRRNRFISFISLSSILGVALGVAVLITTLSIWNGFEQALRQRILGMTAHAMLYARTGWLRDWQTLQEDLSGRAHVVATAPFIRLEGMLTHDGKVKGALVQGIRPEEEMRVSALGQSMRQGQLSDLRAGEHAVILGYALADALHLAVGDHVNLVVPDPAGTNFAEGGLPRFQQFTVSGIFNVDMHEYDALLAYVHLSEAAELAHQSTAVSGLRLQFDDAFAAPTLSRALMTELSGDYYLVDWTQFHVNFFKALASQKSMMLVVLTLIVAVAAFNIVSALVMVVADKRADIAILRTMGLSPLAVMAVFIIQGTLIGVVGAGTGVAAGVWLSRHITAIVPALERLLHTRLFPADVYYLSEVPAQMRWEDVLHVGVIAFALCLLATLYPSWRAARTAPAEALRYE